MKYTPKHTAKFWCDVIEDYLHDELVTDFLLDFSFWFNHEEYRDEDFEKLFDKVYLQEKCIEQIANHFECKNNQVVFANVTTSDLFREGFDPVVIIGDANFDGTWLGDLCNIEFIAGKTNFGEINPYSIEPVKAFCGPVTFGNNAVSLSNVRYFGDKVTIPENNNVLLERYNSLFGENRENEEKFSL